MTEIVAHVAALAAFGLAVGARVRSAPGPLSNVFWAWTAIGLLVAIASPIGGVFAALVALLCADVRSGAFGALVGATAMLGLAGITLGSFIPVATLVVSLIALPVVAAAGLLLERAPDPSGAVPSH